jgi:penicillin-binding protein 2
MSIIDSGIAHLRRIYLGGFLILFISLVYYQIFNGSYYFLRARNNYLRAIPIYSIRGTIFDRNRIALAYDKASFNIAVIPYQLKGKKDFVLAKLGRLSQRDISALQKNYSRRIQNLFSPVDIVLDIDKTSAFNLKEQLGEDILIDPQPQRFYPYSYECAHILGYVKFASAFYEKLKTYGYTPFARVGFSGVEQYYDDYLRGTDGGDLIEVNAQGKIVGFLGNNSTIKGKDIYLTVDYRMQKIAYEALADKRGTVIFMDSITGEILTLTASPSFDPNNFVRGKNVEQFLINKNKPMHNRAIQSSYPLGSTFKPIVLTAALDEGKITLSTTFTCKGKLDLGNVSFRCENIHGKEDVYAALAHSCNVYFYNLGMLVGREDMAQWARKFGLDVLTGIDLPYEKKGIIPFSGWRGLKHWYLGDTLNLAIGQGYIECSPIELLAAINAFANGGYLVKPHLLKSVESVDSPLYTKTAVGLSSGTLKILKQALVGVVDDSSGTAHMLKGLDLKIAGKTGTAQTKTRAHGWFVGFFPYDKPKYAICVFLENAGSSYEALKVVHTFLGKLKEEKLL